MNPPPDESLPLFNLEATSALPSPAAAPPPLASPEAAATLQADGDGEVAAAAPAVPTAIETELDEWKAALRHDFEEWLASIDEIPAADGESAADELDAAPDLYSFYEQFAAASAESRKANRRTAEAMSQWGETLARFEGGLQPLRETVAQLAATQPKAGRMARAHCLVLVELLDRMHRLVRAFATPPVARRAWWGAGADHAWRQTWVAQHQALDILVGHLEGLLTREGVTRLATEGQPFDPATMMAVATELDATRAAQTVVEEIAAGYLRDGELLRTAQVKVTVQP